MQAGICRIRRADAYCGFLSGRQRFRSAHSENGSDSVSTPVALVAFVALRSFCARRACRPRVALITLVAFNSSKIKFGHFFTLLLKIMRCRLCKKLIASAVHHSCGLNILPH